MTDIEQQTRRVILSSDNPVKDATEDTLGRADAARRFADDLLAQDVSEGIVVGVLGAWGSGKTSFINLARSRIKETGTAVLDFNPWMFGGTEQLVANFFAELAAQLRLRPGLAEIGTELGEYGEAFSGLGWLPLVGVWIERGRLINKGLSRLLQRRREGIGERRKQLEQALAKLVTPIVVVLDDIDRLQTAEIREVFRLVRLTASFPNVIYLLAFDRRRVELALSEDGVPGRLYLEKILQLALDLPTVPEQVLSRQVFVALDEALGTVDHPGALDQQAWPDVFMEVIRPLIRNMRDVRRYALAVRGTVGGLEGQIALADVLALEAIRVFLPDVFVRLPGLIDALTTPSASFPGNERSGLKEQIAELVAAGAEHADVVQAAIMRIFPAGQRHLPGGTHYGGEWLKTWLREHRVAHPDILRLYLERVVGEGLEAFREAERAWEVMADSEAFDSFLRGLDIAGLEDVIGALETFEADFNLDHLVPGVSVLLNLLPELPERPRGMFALETRFVVGRVVYRLLRAPNDPLVVETAVSEILPNLSSLTSKLELITDVGYRENAGHKLVGEEAAVRFESEWRAEVRHASTEDLARERDLLRIFLLTRRDSDASEPVLKVPDSPHLTLALLRGARSDSVSQSLGSRAVRRTPRLAWDALVEIFGDEPTLISRVEALRAVAAENDDDGELLELAARYAEGWRPRDFGDE